MTFRQTFCLLAAFFLSVATNLRASASDITINVYNDARVEENTLEKAQAEATRILSQAGINAEWINCKGLQPQQVLSPSCSLPMSQTHLALRVVPFQMEGGDSALGVAFLDENQPGVQADIFYPSLDGLCRDAGTSRSLVLGDVIAHEIGHLLLGTHSHSARGIMRPHWHNQELDQIGKGTLLFTDTQAHTMRTRLMAAPQHCQRF